MQIAETPVSARDVEDSVASEAMEYIQSNCSQLIQVSDVAQAVCVSRSTLDKRFRAVYGTSVLRVIRMYRSQRIAKMLIETDMSVTQIALKMNMPGVEHIGRYFKQQMGLSPIQYRKAKKSLKQ